MSKTNRITQHRPKRESQKKRELADLKRRNRYLEQQLARQPLVETVPCVKCEGAGCEDCVNGQIYKRPKRAQPADQSMSQDASVANCPCCGAPLQVAELGRGVFEMCKACGYRHFQKITSQE